LTRNGELSAPASRSITTVTEQRFPVPHSKNGCHKAVPRDKDYLSLGTTQGQEMDKAGKLAPIERDIERDIEKEIL
jgi:hypothetical protein